jgi:RNA polymerase sigma-70 factor (ECF subfamily)
MDIEAIFAFLASQLPPKTRQVFLMSRLQGMTYSEIAQELEISVKTVENQMGNALKKMRDLLSKYQYLPSIFHLFYNFFQSH